MAFTYIQLYSFYRKNEDLLKRVFNDMERELMSCFYGEESPPTSTEICDIITGVAGKFRASEKAVKSALRCAKNKLDQRYRLARDFNLFQKDSIAFLPISRTEVLWELCRKGFTSLEMLRIAPDKEICAIHGVGKVVLDEIRDAVELHDDKIAPRPEPPKKKKRSPKPQLSRKAISRVGKRERARLQPSFNF